MWKPSKPKLDIKSIDYKDAAKKVAFFAVFGVTGVAAVAAYRYAKKRFFVFDLTEIYIEPEDWA